MKIKLLWGAGLMVSSAFVIACSVASEPAPQTTDTVAPEAVVYACYHCTVTCTDGTSTFSTDYTSCGVPSLSAAQEDGKTACADQFAPSYYPVSTPSCQYIGPSPAPPPPSSTTTQ